MKYAETFKKISEEGYAELVKSKEDDTESCRAKHYITHFATQQDKFRVVYNGALSVGGVSLNDMLYRGPMFLKSLLGILLGFKQHAYAEAGDIRNMFFQIALHPKYRDMLRFFYISEWKATQWCRTLEVYSNAIWACLRSQHGWILHQIRGREKLR